MRKSTVLFIKQDCETSLVVEWVEVSVFLIVYYQQMHLMLILFNLKCLKQ
jgi:hypothetical protein